MTITREPAPPEPPRLVTNDDEVGRLLQNAEDSFRKGLLPNASWQRFQLQRQRRRRWLGLALVPAAALTLTVLAIGTRRAIRNVPPSATRAMTVTPERLTLPPPRTPSSLPTPQPALLDRRISPPLPLAMRPAKSSPIPAADAPNDAHCRGLAKHGSTSQAVTCFETLSRQTGLGAEIALYEAARLAAEGLHDAPRALSLLDEHGARFPKSVLSVEVEWLRVRNLERAGRLAEALSESEALLDSPGGRPLAAKLHLLRGRIYSEGQGDCARAVREYVALLGEAGPAGDDAEFRRAQCLEQLGSASDARAAYERYLTRSDVQRAAQAKERLSALSNSAPSPKGEP